MRNARLQTLARLTGCGAIILAAGSFVSHSIGTAPLGEPVGACCLDHGGDCQMLSPAACADAGGFYLSDGVNCGEADCPSIPDCAVKRCPQDLTGGGRRPAVRCGSG